MTTPIRLQLSRVRGFDLQAVSRAANGLPAVVVSRPGPWGNPFVAHRDEFTAEWFVSERSCHWGPFVSKAAAIDEAIQLYRRAFERPGPHNHRLIAPVPTRGDIMKSLRGRNLACWCKLGAPCHADVLLELANAPVCEAA